MGRRQTRKAGLLQSRHPDPKVQRTFDAIIERLEVLDGLRGDYLDRAVTYRDLDASGFIIGSSNVGGGGGPQITVPGGGDGTDGPGIGPTTPPTNLQVNETFLALLLTWDNPAFNLQHIEVWRNDVDNLSTAYFIGTTVSPQYMDYVGASASFYYWVRAVATDGTYSAFNDTAGTLGTTGLDPSDFEFNLNISGSNLDATLTARINLIDVDGVQDSLMTRMGAAEGDIVALDSRTTTLESTASALQTDVNNNTTLISGNASAISTQQTSITQLLSDMTDAQGDIITNASGITANASDILNLYAAVGSLDSSGGEEWEFLTDTESWVPSNATLTHSGGGTGSVIYSPTGANPLLVSPTIGLSGGIYTQVVMRVRKTIEYNTWEGDVIYSTGGHTATDSFRKTIPEPTWALNEWKTLTWDMSDLTAGGTDWVSSTITGITFELAADSGGRFEIDWIIIAKFSTTAISEALNALDVRVTDNEGDIASQGTAITALQSTVNDGSTGVTATAAALSALTTTVVSNQGAISANSSAITTLQTTVNDGSTGVLANASAITALETDVSTIQGVNTSQASSLTQLVARISGGYASVVNPLTTQGENFGTTYTTGEIQSYNVGGRTGVAARIDTSSNSQEYVHRADGERIYVGPNDIYEVKYSVYHNRPTDAGSFYAGINAYSTETSTTLQNVYRINNRVLLAASNNPYWLSYRGAERDEEWLDVTCYLLGSNVDPSLCPNMVVNGDTTPFGNTFIDGIQIISAPYIRLRFLNYNGSPSYGDDTTTTTYVTNLRVHRIDSAAENYAAIQTEATVTANAVGDLNALYAVKAELNANGIPYVTGFGLAADVIDGVATSAFGIRADQFFIANPNAPTDITPPFSVGLVDEVATVGINGQLIIDGTIRATSIVARDIGAAQITVTSLNALTADMGVLVSGILTTKGRVAYVDPNGVDIYEPNDDFGSWRVEIQDAFSTAYPLWYGQGPKSAGNGRFYVTNTGDVIVKGLLDAGMIKQSYFTPSAAGSSFRIACDYPSNYSAGVYTGKTAYLSPVVSVNEAPGSTVPSITAPYYSGLIQFLGPTNTGSREYGRLGSTSEIVSLDIHVTETAVALLDEFTSSASITTRVILQYRYDSEPWSDATSADIDIIISGSFVGGGTAVYNSGATMFSVPFITKGSAFSTVEFRLKVGELIGATATGTLATLMIRGQTYNFGISDLTATNVSQTTTTDPDPIETMPPYPRYLPPGTLPP